MFKLGSLFKLTSQRETSCDDDFMSASSLQRRKNGLAGLTSPSAAVEHKTIKFSTNKGDFEYTGTCILNSETFHGSGTLLYPNGSCYEGDFENGKRCGFGKLIYHSSDKKKSSWVVIGEWLDGLPKPNIQWKITCENNYEYWGYIELDQSKSDFDILDINDFHKTKEGELYCKPNDRYFGSFVNNMKDGYGVQVFSNKNRYFGGWKEGKFHGHGTFIYYDGTMFQGTFLLGVRKGKGTMYWPNGDNVSGEWNGNSVDKAVFDKGTCKKCSPTALYQMKQEITNELRNQFNAGYMTKTYGFQEDSTTPPSYSLKWKQFKVIHESVAKGEQELLADSFCSQLKTLEDFKKCVFVLLDGSKDLDESQMFFKSAVEFFLSAFHGTYYSNSGQVQMKNHQATMHYAIEDVKSFITFLFDEIWQYFTNMFEEMIEHSKDTPATKKNKSPVNPPRYKTVLNSDLTEKELVTLQRSCYSECEPFIAAYVHRKLCDTFFALYEATYQEKDLLINQKLDSLQSCMPEQFGVSPKFLPPADSIEAKQPYAKSISLFEDLLRNKTVTKKIEVLSCLREVLLLEIRQHRAANRRAEKEKSGGYTDKDAQEDNEWQPGAEDATPVETYVFIRSKIRNHHSQFKYINDWKDDSVRLHPVSHLITFYEGFLNFIEDLDPSLKNGDGVFISNYSITKAFERAIEKEIGDVPRHEIQPTLFNWVPLILVFLSLEVGRRSGTSIDRIEIPLDSQLKLANAIIQNQDMVQRVLSRVHLLGFSVTVKEGSVFLEMSTVLPTHVYSDAALQMTKFIRFELDR